MIKDAIEVSNSKNICKEYYTLDIINVRKKEKEDAKKKEANG